MSQAFNDLVSGKPQYLLTPYSRSHALGFKGDTEDINLAYNLFSNYDDTHLAPPISWISHGLAFISMTPERLRETIRIYLEVNMLHRKEVATTSMWDEENAIYTLVQDEEAATIIAGIEADAFVRDHVQYVNFLPVTTFSTNSSESYKYRGYRTIDEFARSL